MKFEDKFESILWNLRYVVILAVILSVLASITLFIIGSWDIVHAIVFQNPITNDSINQNNNLLFKIISSIDMFLIGIVLLIFGFGVYELFISEIDIAKDKFSSTLKISTLDQLKNKIIKVVIIVLIVKFFEKILKLTPNFNTPQDLLLLSVSILAICLGFYLINKK